MSTRNERFSFIEIKDGGWHLSFMGGKERVKEKLKSYGHQEFNNDSILNNVDNKMDRNVDILNRSITIKTIDITNFYPDILKKLINEKFKYLIK
jgi:beta-1,4-mannosyl-glycoprotein beta-1,4-N-acetylglucosaminyltransferase